MADIHPRVTDASAMAIGQSVDAPTIDIMRHPHVHVATVDPAAETA